MDKEIYRRVKQRVVKVRRLLTDAEKVEQSTTYGDPVVTGVNDDETTGDTDPKTEVTVKNAAAQVVHCFHGDPIYFHNVRSKMSCGNWDEGLCCRNCL